jgi:hypothetical protein
MNYATIGLTATLLFYATAASAATPAQARVEAARSLENTFDSSQISGFGLRFIVRGKQCDVLQVEGGDVNLHEQMMHALANGTVMYGQILPGGVNQYAFTRGFRRVIYTNEGNTTYISFGQPKLTRTELKKMQRCTDSIAAKLSAPEAKTSVPAPPTFEPLSWAKAGIGTKLYDGAYKHEATIVAIRRSEGIIEVKYVRSGAVEPKLLSAVSRFWYVRK